MSELSPLPAFGNFNHPFRVEALGVRGWLVRLAEAVDGVLAPHAYPPAVGAMLGQALALAAALAAGIKYDGVFTVQAQGDGPLGMIIADIASDGALRGYARYDASRLQEEATGGPVPRLLGAGHLAFTVDQGAHTELYQGITELTGATLADCAHNYFRQSEQLPTAIVLASATAAEAGGARAAALMIQRLPSPTPGQEVDDDEQWRRAEILTGSVSEAELLDAGVTPSDLLYRLYHADGARIYRPRPLRFACRCSRRRVAGTLGAFPRSEVEDMAEDGKVTVTCEFCKAVYEFDGAGIDNLFTS